MPDIAWQVSAQESVSTSIGRISQALAGLDASDAKTFGQMVRNLSNAETATIRTATALQRLETVQAQTDAAQSRAASAALRLSQAQEQAARGYRDVGQAATQHAPAAASFFSNALSAATGFLAANVFSRVASGFGDIIGGVVGASASMEQTRAGFTSLLGSAQAADTLIKQLQAEANKSPFDLESFRKASQLLLGMGVAADDVVPRLHNVSNVVAAVGGGKEQFDRISLALGQIQAKGKLSAEEVNQLAEAGVPAWDLLANAMGKSKAEVIDLAQQGKITADVFNQAFAQFANSDQISQAAERNSHTFNGLLSTIGDIGQALETAFGTPVLAAVEPVLERIVGSLQDPAVVTTLGQWGAAAGQFAVGLIQAGQTAFTVAQQIIQALQPVTDFLGGLLGIQGPTAPAFTPPDFTPAAQSAGQFGAAIQQGATNTKSAKDQVAELERQTRELSRGAADTGAAYDKMIQPLRDQLTLLDRAYESQNKQNDLSKLDRDIARDKALAVDAYSSQGQSAKTRLEQEEERRSQLVREIGHDRQKQALQDNITGIERQKAAASANASAQQRAIQEQIDALRAATAASTAFTTALTGGPDKSRNRNVDDAFGGPQTAGKAQTTLGLLAQLQAALEGLSQGPKAAIDALTDSWSLLAGGFDATPPKLISLGHGFDDLIDTLGGKGGLQGVAISVRYEFERLFESLAAAAPTVVGAVGRTFTNLGDSINVATTSASELIALFKLQTGQGTQAQFDQAHKAAADAQEQYRKDQVKAMVDSALQGGTYQDRIKALNADINRRETTDLNAAAGRTQASRDARLGGVTQASSEYQSTYGPITTTASRNAPPRAEIVLTFDENGVAHAIQKHTSADRLLRVMGDAVR